MDAVFDIITGSIECYIISFNWDAIINDVKIISNEYHSGQIWTNPPTDPVVRDQDVIGHLFAMVNIDMTGKSNSF